MMENGKGKSSVAYNQVGRFIRERGYVNDHEGMVPVKVLFADFREWQEEAGMARLTFLDFESEIRGVTACSRRYIETGGKRQFLIAGIRKGEQEILFTTKREKEMQKPGNHKAVTAETHTPESVEFMGKQLLGVKVEDEVYVAMKPVVEGMGLDWRGQQAKIKSDIGYGDISIPLQTPGGIQEMTCIPLTKLNGWLFSINKNKVHPDLREKVVAYQDECFLALYNYFNKGAAINPDMLTEGKKEEIVDAVKKAAPARVEEDVREITLMKDEQIEKMLMEATRKEGTSDQVKEVFKEIADTVNYSQFPVRTDCNYFRFDEKTMFQLVYQALQNLDDPLSPESINAFKISYCAAARCMLPRMAQGIIHHMQIEGVLEKGC